MNQARLNQPINHDGQLFEPGLHEADSLPAWAFEAGLALRLSEEDSGTSPAPETGAKSARKRSQTTPAPETGATEVKVDGPDNQ